jgi:hypothetical protein
MGKVGFVRNPKTGSTSVTEALNGVVVCRAHQPASYYFDLGLKTFAFVRNPWERAHSWWRHQRYFRQETFREYILGRAARETLTHGKEDTGLLFHDQYNWLRVGDRYVNYIGYFECLWPDYKLALYRFDLQPVKEFPHQNLNVDRDKYPYSPDLWDDDMVKEMEPLFQELAIEFGYHRP